MVFPRGSAAEKQVRSLKSGDMMHVLGTPRVNLAIIAWRIANAQSRSEVLRWNLPYEIIVDAVYE